MSEEGGVGPARGYDPRVPMARRSTARGAARRRQILDGALAAIRERAVADVQLTAIADRAGLKPSHVLYYFASRDEVLVAAAAHAEEALSAGRSERLRAIADPTARLREYVAAYLPDDRDDPVWKLWIEGWLRSASREEFGEVGWEAYLGWRSDLVEALGHAAGDGAPPADELTALAQRFIVLLDGLAVHVLAGHVEIAEATEMAMDQLRSQLARS